MHSYVHEVCSEISKFWKSDRYLNNDDDKWSYWCINIHNRDVSLKHFLHLTFKAHSWFPSPLTSSTLQLHLLPRSLLCFLTLNAVVLQRWLGALPFPFILSWHTLVVVSSAWLYKLSSFLQQWSFYFLDCFLLQYQQSVVWKLLSHDVCLSKLQFSLLLLNMTDLKYSQSLYMTTPFFWCPMF